MSHATKHHWANTEDKGKNVNAFSLKSNNGIQFLFNLFFSLFTIISKWLSTSHNQSSKPGNSLSLITFYLYQ